MSVFQLTAVSKIYGAQSALTDVNLQIDAGERVALIGPSGAGKSTLLGLLNGTVQPTAGRVFVLGQSLATLAPRPLRQLQRQIGTIYQQFHLVDQLRVIHNVNAGHLGEWGLGKSLFSLLWPQEIDRAYAALARMGIGEKLYARTSELSGGEQQRVALARVLIQNPTAILADEPIASIDPQRSREIMNLLRDLATEGGKTLVASLHDVDFALSHFDRIIGLRNGRLLFDQPAAQVTPARLERLYQIDHRVDQTIDEGEGEGEAVA